MVLGDQTLDPNILTRVFGFRFERCNEPSQLLLNSISEVKKSLTMKEPRCFSGTDCLNLLLGLGQGRWYR
jgi:hypothetical protein